MRVRFGGTVLDLRYSQSFVIFVAFLMFVVLALYHIGAAGGRKNELRNEPSVSSPPEVDLQNDQLFTKHDNSNENPRKMAMDKARHKYKTILKMQDNILKTQNRPPDSQYNINITLSDSISMDRKVTDTRPLSCLPRKYTYSQLPKASVIIPFYNEALSMVLRTVHSILNNSPDELLNEIILVDDKSTRDYLGVSFAKYIQMLPKTILLRNTERIGLIRSRLRGSRMARGPVVVFLDAHTEANVGWLEPLLQEILDHPNTVAQPFVDGIEPMSIEYSAPPSLYMGSFSWDLRYTWLKVPDHIADHALETGTPYFSPTLVGCAIAVDKDYFEKIGEFDEGLKVWGGENIELGFRTWQCGGRVTTVLCSRVGHVFKNFPYKFDGDRETIVAKNLMRVTETWMDSYRKYYYASARTYEFKRTEFNTDELASLKERIELRKRLNCMNFEWYMQNIIPELETPPTEAVYYGEIQNTKTQACWEILNDYQIGMNYLCYEHKIIPKNFFSLTNNGLLKFKDKCVQVSPRKPVLQLSECEESRSLGSWEMVKQGHTWGHLRVKLKNAAGQMDVYCIMQVTNIYGTKHDKEQMPEVAKCEENNEFQIWAFTWKFSWDQVPKHIQASHWIS